MLTTVIYAHRRHLNCYVAQINVHTLSLSRCFVILVSLCLHESRHTFIKCYLMLQAVKQVFLAYFHTHRKWWQQNFYMRVEQHVVMVACDVVQFNFYFTTSEQQEKKGQ